MNSSVRLRIGRLGSRARRANSRGVSCGFRRATLRALTGLDFGLRIHVYPRSPQRQMFCGPRNHAAQALISDLASDLSGLRVYSYALRGQLEDALSALQLNAEGGSWRYARRAASDTP